MERKGQEGKEVKMYTLGGEEIELQKPKYYIEKDDDIKTIKNKLHDMIFDNLYNTDIENEVIIPNSSRKNKTLNKFLEDEFYDWYTQLIEDEENRKEKLYPMTDEDKKAVLNLVLKYGTGSIIDDLFEHLPNRYTEKMSLRNFQNFYVKTKDKISNLSEEDKNKFTEAYKLYFRSVVVPIITDNIETMNEFDIIKLRNKDPIQVSKLRIVLSLKLLEKYSKKQIPLDIFYILKTRGIPTESLLEILTDKTQEEYKSNPKIYIPDYIKNQCQSELDLSYVDELKNDRDLMMFYLENFDSKGNKIPTKAMCLKREELLQLLRPENQVYLWYQITPQANCCPNKGFPVYKLLTVWVEGKIDMLLAFNTFLLHSPRTELIGSSFGVSNLHGAEEKIYQVMPISRIEGIEGTFVSPRNYSELKSNLVSSEQAPNYAARGYLNFTPEDFSKHYIHYMGPYFNCSIGGETKEGKTKGSYKYCGHVNKNRKPNGFGFEIQYDSSGKSEQMLVGQWKNLRPIDGIFVNNDFSVIYVGQFRDGRSDGTGRFLTKNYIYSGIFKDGYLVDGSRIGLKDAKKYDGLWESPEIFLSGTISYGEEHFKKELPVDSPMIVENLDMKDKGETKYEKLRSEVDTLLGKYKDTYSQLGTITNEIEEKLANTPGLISQIFEDPKYDSITRNSTIVTNILLITESKYIFNYLLKNRKRYYDLEKLGEAFHDWKIEILKPLLSRYSIGGGNGYGIS